MSEASEAALLTIVVADFVNSESGKVNIIGGGVSLIGYDPFQRTTSRFAVYAYAEIPARALPAEIALELALMTGDEVAVIAGPMGPQAIRVAQSQTVERAQAPISLALRDHVGGGAQIVLDFQNGLPLEPNTPYEFRLQIDGDEQHELRYPIAVVGPPPGAVVG